MSFLLDTNCKYQPGSPGFSAETVVRPPFTAG